MKGFCSNCFAMMALVSLLFFGVTVASHAFDDIVVEPLGGACKGTCIDANAVRNVAGNWVCANRGTCEEDETTGDCTDCIVNEDTEDDPQPKCRCLIE